jgi:uncharacterized protein YegP (UPF0339 family)
VKIEIYNSYLYRGQGDVQDRWYWRGRAANGHTMMDGAEAYYKLGNAKRAVKRAMELLGATNYEIVVLD